MDLGLETDLKEHMEKYPMSHRWLALAIPQPQWLRRTSFLLQTDGDSRRLAFNGTTQESLLLCRILPGFVRHDLTDSHNGHGMDPTGRSNRAIAKDERAGCTFGAPTRENYLYSSGLPTRLCERP